MNPLASALAVQAEEVRSVLRRHRAALSVGCVFLLGGGVAFWLSSGEVRRGVAAAAAADPRLELAAAAGFACSLAATALGWRLAFGALGARLSPLDSCARYAAGSIVNTLLPARLGDAARVALFGRSLPRREGWVLTSAGILGAMALCRGVVHALVIACAAFTGVVPLWPLASVAAAFAIVVTGLVVVHRRGRSVRIERLICASALLVSRPLLGLGLLGWSLLAVIARVVAAASVAAAVGLPSPFLTALVITAALDVAATLPLTPGGLGLTSGAISFALTTQGVPLPAALAAGLVFHLVETLTSLGFAACVLPPAVRPGAAANLAPKLVAAGVTAALVIVGASALVDFA